ncbi:CHAT domain-containing protein [Micromonospora sp. NPDC049047]|uniref:CHAT domain-containing protein n=1 Tax=Micromonospora sp. NPDC049047 TaxID=3155645 RepID=UPI0033C9048B
MGENGWAMRWVADQARGRVGEFVHDTTLAEQIERMLAEALARDPGPLTDLRIAHALRADPALERWAMETVRAAESRFRSTPGMAPPARYLTTELPRKVRLGSRISLWATITRDGGGGSVPVRPFAIPDEGVVVEVAVQSSTLTLHGHGVHYLRVHPDSDSSTVAFTFEADREGPHEIKVQMFLAGGGGQLAATTRTVLVVADASYAPPRRASTRVEHLDASPGTIALQVDRTRSGYLFRLVGRDGITATADAVPRRMLADLLRSANTMAAGTSRNHPAVDRGILNGFGTALWRALPPEIGAAVASLLESATGLVICTELADLPWELLRPPGWETFVAERLPVLRQPGRYPLTRSLPLRDPVFVLGAHPPNHARAEIGRIAALLDGSTPTVIASAAQLVRRIEQGDFGLLHLACHQEHPDGDGGGGVRMDDGTFRPIALPPAAARRSLAARCPLVFFNACHSADGGSYDTLMGGWANEFLSAGAGAFVGSTWAVRSEPASEYAAYLYTELRAGASLAMASLAARRAVGQDNTDPTHLAYAVYGDPQATVPEGPDA